MSYNSVIDALQALLDADAPSLGAIATSQADYDSLNESHACVVIIDYNGLTGERAEFGPSYYNAWEFELTLAIPFQHAKQGHDDMAILRQYVLEKIGSDPDLGNTVETTLVTRGEAIPQTIEAGGQSWQVELLYVTAREIVEY